MTAQAELAAAVAERDERKRKMLADLEAAATLEALRKEQASGKRNLTLPQLLDEGEGYWSE